MSLEQDRMVVNHTLPQSLWGFGMEAGGCTIRTAALSFLIRVPVMEGRSLGRADEARPSRLISHAHLAFCKMTVQRSTTVALACPVMLG